MEFIEPSFLNARHKDFHRKAGFYYLFKFGDMCIAMYRLLCRNRNFAPENS